MIPAISLATPYQLVGFVQVIDHELVVVIDKGVGDFVNDSASFSSLRMDSYDTHDLMATLVVAKKEFIRLIRPAEISNPPGCVK